jgi:tetratricopeptide (TPR) repeat protein
VPEACLNQLSQPLFSRARLPIAVRGLLVSVPLALAFTTASRAETLITAPVVHITDDQDKLGNGRLKRTAEARSHANALYAQATLLSEGNVAEQQQALSLFRQVVDLDPAFIEARIKLANLLLQTGQLDQAYTLLSSATADHPGCVPLEVALGYTQRLRGQSEEALKLCRRALIADPTQAGAMRVMLEIAADQEDLAGGVLHIGDILKNGASDVPASAWLNLAQLYSEVAGNERNPPSAEVMLNTRLPILQQAATKPPPDIGALTLLADTYHKLGRKSEALKTFRKAGDLEPSNVDIALNCAELETDLGDISSAIKDYENADDLSPGLPGLRERLCSLYVDQGIAYEKARHPEKAQASFQKVFDSMDCPPDSYLKLASYQIEHQQLKQAGETLAAAQTRFPQSATVRYYQAIQNRNLKNYDAAIANLDQAHALAVGTEAGVLNIGYYLESALIFNLAGQKDRLETILREAIGKFPNNPEIMNELAYFWADKGVHLPEALDLSQRAAKLEPDNGPILDTQGWVYFQMGQAKDALPFLQRAALMTNNDPVVLQHVGDAYLKLGLRREAIDTWTRALQKDPQNGDLTNRIDAAQAQAKNAHSRSAPTP